MAISKVNIPTHRSTSEDSKNSALSARSEFSAQGDHPLRIRHFACELLERQMAGRQHQEIPWDRPSEGSVLSLRLFADLCSRASSSHFAVFSRWMPLLTLLDQSAESVSDAPEPHRPADFPWILI